MKQSSAPATAGLLVLAPVILAGIIMAWSWNGLIGKEEAVISAWSQVESNYQRRADLVPSLVSTVKAYAEQERTVLQETVEVRTRADNELTARLMELSEAQEKAAALSEKGENRLSDEDYMKNLARAQAILGERMKNVFAVAESYPHLRSSENFLQLQAQLEGTENRINVARLNFNEQARRFNAAMRRFPGNILAGMGDFKRKAYFEADDGAEKAVNVNFDSAP